MLFVTFVVKHIYPLKPANAINQKKRGGRPPRFSNMIVPALLDYDNSSGSTWGIYAHVKNTSTCKVGVVLVVGIARG